jgi:hypothetical protein
MYCSQIEIPFVNNEKYYKKKNEKRFQTKRTKQKSKKKKKKCRMLTSTSGACIPH